MEEGYRGSDITRFRVLGAAELRGPEGNEILSILARPKLLALLTYLAASSTRGFQRRDTLIGLLWAESDQERARNALRQSLFHLRRALGEDVLIGRGEDEVGLAEARFWCDVAAFEAAHAYGNYEEALELYRGDLLEGFFPSDGPEFEDWLDGRRRQLREKAAAAAWQLAEHAGVEGRHADAGMRARQALSLAPRDEELLRRAMTLLDSCGDRSGAIRVYEEFTRRLREELDLEPAPETQALADTVRSRSATGKPGSPLPASAGASPATSNRRAPAAEPAMKPAGLAAPVRDQPSSRRRAFRSGLIAGAALVLGVLIVWAFQSGDENEPYLSPQRVVVAAFSNQTGDPAMDPLGRMAADMISQSLRQTNLIQVVPPEAAFQFDAAGDDPGGETWSGHLRTLAEATRAGTVVSGMIYQFADSLWIQAHVTDARDGQLLTSVESSRAAGADPLRPVESIRQRVVGALATTLDGRIGQFADVARQPPTYEAYRAFTEAQSLYDRSWTPGAGAYRDDAERLFLEALELDSTLVVAWVRAAWTAVIRGNPARADSLAQKGAEYRDELSPFARAQLDMLQAELRGDRTAALHAARQLTAAPLDPAWRALWVNRPRETLGILEEAEYYPEAVRRVGLYGVEQLYWQLSANAHHMLGEYKEELEVAQTARKRYPSALWMLELEVSALAALGRVDDVYERLEESLNLPAQALHEPGLTARIAAAELRAHGARDAALTAAGRSIDWYRSHPEEPTIPDRHRVALALSHYVAENWEEARELYEQLADDFPDNINYQGFLGTLAARRGDRDAALEISANLEGMNDPYDFGRDKYWQACIAAQLGERERAMALLRDAYARGRAYDITLHLDLDLEPLWNYPPFQEFLEPRG